jgi:hypothetical protein
MIDFLLFLFALLQIAFVYGFYRLYMAHWEHAARLTQLENQKLGKVEPKAAPAQAKQVWDKKIEGFNPKKPATVLPRSEQERNARVKTVREVNENVFEFDSKL